MDLTPAPGFRKRPSDSLSSGRGGESALSPQPCSPSSSVSSPSSAPSSPLSTSSSACANSSAYPNHVNGKNEGTEVAAASSTSVSLSTQSQSTRTSKAISANHFPHISMQQSVDFEECSKEEMYDPFNPTDEHKEDKEQAGEADGDKYDPFDPTGSPASDSDDQSEKAGVTIRDAEIESEEEKDEEPPDSTETLMELPSPCVATRLPLRRRVDCSSTKAGGRREGVESDHSEIEEGEIVGAAERDKRNNEDVHTLNSPNVSFFGSMPERILRVLDGDSFVSVCAEGSWEVDGEPEDEPVVGVEDLRCKLVSRRKERYLSFPPSSPLSPQPAAAPPSHPSPSLVLSPLHIQPLDQSTMDRKSAKTIKEDDQPKIKNRKSGVKEARRKKRRKDKDGLQERSKDKEREHKTTKDSKTRRRSSRSSSHKRKKRHHSSPEASRSHNSTGRGSHLRHSISSLSEERQRERERDKNKRRDREKDRDRNRDTERERGKERSRSNSHSHRRDDRDRQSSSRKRERERDRKGRQHTSSTERSVTQSSRRDGGQDRLHERDRRRDGRPVVPPSIQDLNGPDLFAIKRTITVTTTTTTTTVPGSPRLTPTSPCRTSQNSDKPYKRKKKRQWHSGGELNDRGGCRSRSRSLSPPRYHSYESDHFSDKLEIDVLSLDGEALDSDYPSLEDTPPASLALQPPIASPTMKAAPKSRQRIPKKKSRSSKKIGLSESSSSSSSNRTKSKCLSSLTITSGSASVSSGLPSAKRARKIGKDKDQEKSNRKEVGRSGKTKKESSGGRKGKLQSKVSVLMREGVSSTTGASVGHAKLGLDLLGPGGPGPGGGGSVVGGSIAVVFCRDNESRSPFLKPCSEPLGGRSKDLNSLGKRNNLSVAPSSLTSPAGIKSKKTKLGSITSTSSSASSPTSTLVTKRRRRLAKKTKEKGGAASLQTTGDGSLTKAPSEVWSSASQDAQSGVGDAVKSLSPHTGQPGPAPCSSSSSSSTSSSTSALPPSSSPPHTPPPSVAPLRETRESSPDSQTVDSSCKTPEACFLVDTCPTPTSPPLPASSPSSMSAQQSAGLSNASSAPVAKPPTPEDPPKTITSPPSSTSSSGCGLNSLSLSSSDPSSSSVSSSSASKPPPPPPAAPALPWGLQTGVDCTTGGVLALTALLFKMEEANIASRAKAQEFIQATSQILSQTNQNQSQQHAPPSTTASSSSVQIPPPPSLPPPPGLSPAQFILHSSLPLVGCTKATPSHLHPALGGGCAQTPPPIMPLGLGAGGSGDFRWDGENKDPDKYLKKLHTQERAVEEVKLAIKPYYQRKDINKDDYKDILRKAVHKICHSRTGEINPVKVSNLVKLYVQRYKYFRKHGRKMDEEERDEREPGGLY